MTKNVDKYLLPNILNEKLFKYKDHIIDFFETNNYDFLYGQKRDNCGVVAGAFCIFMQTKNINIIRVQGDFLTDNGSYKKLDFYKEELIEMRSLNLDPDDLNDRMRFSEIKSLTERQKKIPHYWNQDDNGLIIDLSGFSQFIKTGLVKDLDSSRYLPYDKPQKTIKLKTI